MTSFPSSPPRRLRGLAWASLALVVCFGWPLYHLAHFSFGAGRGMWSHIFLVPLVSAYLVWWKRQSLPRPSASYRAVATACFLAGALALAGYLAVILSASPAAPEDRLTPAMLSFLLLFAGLCALFLGRPLFRAVIFPLGFLVFMIPFPAGLTSWFDTNLQIGSAMVARGLFGLTGTPLFYHNLVFKLPDIAIRVAPECSGIHSSLALLITSVLAAHVFLRTRWKQVTLALAVIPLGMLRNGFRVWVIGELCVHIGPQMIDSPIHHKGGPLFFVLALVPFFLLLYWLYKSDWKKGVAHGAKGGALHRE